MAYKQDLRNRQKITSDPSKMKKVRGNVITSIFFFNLSFFEFDVVGGFWGGFFLFF